MVVDAKVTATSQSTGVATATTTRRTGTYTIQFLAIGAYTITVNANGFKTTSIGPFQLEIDQVAKIDAKLQVGDTSTTVAVSAETAPLLQTQNATLGTTISANTMVNIPINGLNYQFPTLFVPGAVLPTVSSLASSFITISAGEGSPLPLCMQITRSRSTTLSRTVFICAS